jgi:hypothetical protein
MKEEDSNTCDNSYCSDRAGEEDKSIRAHEYTDASSWNDLIIALFPNKEEPAITGSPSLNDDLRHNQIKVQANGSWRGPYAR